MPSGEIDEAIAGGPSLLADVGGTNTRFALEKAPGLIGDVRVYPCSRFAGINEAISAYLAEVCRARVRYATIAIANPVDDDMVRMTNHDRCFSIEATRRALDLDVLRVVNDFTALAMAVPYFSEAQRRQVGGDTQRCNGTIGVLGAGTGLGVSGLIPGREHWIPLSGEGGHITFAPIDERDIDILKFAWKTWPHV